MSQPDLVALGNVADVDSGPAFKSSMFGGPGDGIRLVRGDNIEPGFLRWARTKTWPESELTGHEHLFIEADDLILGMDRPVIKAGLKLARVRPADLPALLVQRVARIRPREAGSDYLYHWLSSPQFARHLQGTATGTQLPHVTLKSIREYPVPRFDADEERRIVDLLEDHLSRLDAAENYLSAARRRLAKLEWSALEAHFGGPGVPLSDLIEDISAGKSFGGANAPAPDGEWGIIKVSAMTWGQFDPTENKAVTSAARVDPRFEIREGDLLVSRANTSEYVGASVLVRHVRPKLLLSDKSLRLTPRAGVDSEWLWRALQAPSARRQISAFATGTKDSMRNISQAALKGVFLPKVSNDEQAVALKSFNEVADAVALLRRQTATAGQRMEALRRSLLTAAFSGRLTGDAVDLSEVEGMISA